MLLIDGDMKGSPVRTQLRFNVETESSQRYGRCIDVLTMLCEYREWF